MNIVDSSEFCYLEESNTVWWIRKQTNQNRSNPESTSLETIEQP